MMGSTTLSIQGRLEPCPFCDSENVVVLRTEGINDEASVCYCRTCEQEWSEQLSPSPTAAS